MNDPMPDRIQVDTVSTGDPPPADATGPPAPMFCRIYPVPEPTAPVIFWGEFTEDDAPEGAGPVVVIRFGQDGVLSFGCQRGDDRSPAWYRLTISDLATSARLAHETSRVGPDELFALDKRLPLPGKLAWLLGLVGMIRPDRIAEVLGESATARPGYDPKAVGPVILRGLEICWGAIHQAKFGDAELAWAALAAADQLIDCFPPGDSSRGIAERILDACTDYPDMVGRVEAARQRIRAEEGGEDGR